MIETAIFDMDGTLLDSMDMWSDIGARYLRSIGIAPREGLRKELIPYTLRQSAGYFREHYGVDQTDEEMMAGFDRLLYDAYAKELPLKPGAQRLLEELNARGVRMCVATATDRRYTEAALKRLDIMKYFEFILTCSEVGYNKRTPEIFNLALERLNGDKATAVIFEDAYHAIKCAKENGYRVCAIYEPDADTWREEIVGMADHYIHNLEELEINQL